MYADTGFTRRIGLLRNLISIRRENCDSMAQYITSIIETSQRLNNTGFEITEEWVGSLLLTRLPEKFAPMIMAIEHSGITITTDAIKTKLIDIDDQSEISAGTQQSAFASKDWQHGNHSKHDGGDNSNASLTQTSNTRRTIKCYKCHKTGHYKNQCDLQKKKQSNAFCAIFLSAKFSTTDFYIDSGASMHITEKKQWLKHVSMQSVVEEFVIEDKSRVSVECCGDSQITTLVNSTEYEIPITEVLYVPGIATNLLSVSQLVKKGNKVIFNDSCCKIYNQKNELVATADFVEGVYKLNIKQVECLFTPVSERIWHRRFAHLNSTDLEKMEEGAVKRQKPDVSHLRIFGSKVMVHIPKERSLKWDKKAKQCILVGYPDDVKGYGVYNPNNNFITSRDIVMIEEGTEKE
ncbi:unnamed protein product [Hermetia illucens]|uniref:CCHC-type domain-containing protein n=1 Tax=Hermetia illucens TaxID=343691 RepID=A0A7R8UHC1_HERIL|nr:unnamed protein product [Hermetia illucens]